MRCKLRFIAQLETTKLKSKCLENEAATETKNVGNNHKAGQWRGEEEGRVSRGECKNYAGNTCLACKRTKQQERETRDGRQHSGTSQRHTARGGWGDGDGGVGRDRSCT